MERTTDIPSRGHAVGGGVVAGVIGGAVMEILLLITMRMHGGDIWAAMKGAATPFVHARAQQPGFDAPMVLLGLCCHFAISIIWGALFALLFYGLSKGATVIAGAFWGIVVWLVMYYAVLPIAGLAAAARGTPVANAVIMHVVFGLAVGLGFLPFQRTRTHAPPSVRAPITS
jgi:hypothetical protein